MDSSSHAQEASKGKNVELSEDFKKWSVVGKPIKTFDDF